MNAVIVAKLKKRKLCEINFKREKLGIYFCNAVIYNKIDGNDISRKNNRTK